jgi:hypothetical protein
VTAGRRLGAAAVVAAAACSSLDGIDGAVASLSFDAPPYPAVVAGDTLRDEAGRAAPLTAVALDAAGAPVADAVVRFVLVDTGARTTDAGFLIAGVGTRGAVRIVAQAGILQTPPRSVTVTARPDSVRADGPAPAELTYRIPDDPAQNVTAAATVRVLAAGGGAVDGASGWLVRWELRYRGALVPVGDTSVVWLVNDQGRPSAVDTTDAQGRAARRVRVRAGGLANPVDTLLVSAIVTHRGSAVRGSPIRLAIPIRPR